MILGKRLLFLLVMLASSLLTAESNLACTCGLAPPAQGEELKTMRDLAIFQNKSTSSSTVIFEGIVEKQEVKMGPIGAPPNAWSMTPRGVHRVVTLRVLRTYRGNPGAIATVLTGMGTGDCGFNFETGKEYLVYANNVDAVTLFTSICTGTTPLEEAGPKLRVLRDEPPTADDLLDPQSYYKKYEPMWTGKVCGRVIKSDGSPLTNASIDMTQVRSEPLPPMSASDPNLSTRDGSFCVADVSPGKYLLTAEGDDYDANTRWVGYYPGVTERERAVPIDVKAGTNLSGVQLTVREQPVFTIHFRVVTSDGSPVPWENLRVAIDSPYTDPLAYHEDQGLDEDGSCELHLIPAGHYSVRTLVVPDSETGLVPAGVSKWQMATQEVDITGKTEVVLKLSPKQGN